MEENAHLPIEEMELFRRYVEIADWAWELVGKWPAFAQDTMGKQLVRAADSIGANLVEGDGRHSVGDALRFFVIARASARETRYWIERSIVRRLIPDVEGRDRLEALKGATQLLNRLIAYRRRAGQKDRVREARTAYEAPDADPFTVWGPEHLNTRTPEHPNA